MASTLALAIAAVASACGDDNSEDASTVDASSGAVTEISIAASDELKFDPSEIEVQAGQPVRVTVDNVGNTVLHDWTVQAITAENVTAHGSESGGHDMDSTEYDLHVAVEGGESATIEFTALDPGEYEFLCTVTGHADAGMTGTLIVLD